MSIGVFVAILVMTAVAAAVVASNVWWSRHRARETQMGRKKEDREIEKEMMNW